MKQPIRRILTALLYVASLAELFFVRQTALFCLLMLPLCAGGLAIGLMDSRPPRRRRALLTTVSLSAAGLCALWHLITRAYIPYVLVSAMGLLGTLGLSTCGPLEKIKTAMRWYTKLLYALSVVLPLFLLVTAISPTPLIVLIQHTVYPTANSDTPFHEPVSTLTKAGHRFIGDIRYGDTYPNSYLDILIADDDAQTARPTFFYIHGGAYAWGDKVGGDPNGWLNTLDAYYMQMLDAGYNVVTLDYAFTPEYTYPTPLYQISEAITFLQTHAAQYGLDMSRVILGGTSAGGQLAGQFACIQTDSAYAQEMGIAPVIEADALRAVVFSSSLLDCERFDNTGVFLTDWLFLQCGRAYFGGGFLRGQELVMQSDVIDHITAAFPPSYISDGNIGTFDDQAADLGARMQALGIRCVLNLHQPLEALLLHGYETGTDIWAQDNMRHLLSFLSELSL